MSKTNLVLAFVIVLIVGALGGYTFGMSGGHDEDYIKESAEMMQSDSKMMKEMGEIMGKGGVMMEERGVKYNDVELTAEGKVYADKSKELLKESEEMMTRGNKMMDMMK